MVTERFLFPRVHIGWPWWAQEEEVEAVGQPRRLDTPPIKLAAQVVDKEHPLSRS